MKYLCLVYGEEAAISKMDDLKCLDFDQSIRDSGHCVASEALEPVATARTVRVRNGKVATYDGPFAETKEQLAGFYLIEARDMDEATEIASRIPPASVGCVEVRPLRPIRVEAGEEIIIAKAGRPAARLVPMEGARKPVKIGGLKARVPLPDDFNTMFEDEIAALFGSGQPLAMAPKRK